MPKSGIEDPGRGFLTGDTLKFHFQVMESEKWISGLPELAQELGSMLDDEELSDIKLMTSTKSFPASKIILAGIKSFAS